MLAALDKGLGGRRLESAPEAFRAKIAELVQARETSRDVRRLRLGASLRHGGLHERIMELAADPKMPTADACR